MRIVGVWRRAELVDHPPSWALTWISTKRFLLFFQNFLLIVFSFRKPEILSNETQMKNSKDNYVQVGEKKVPYYSGIFYSCQFIKSFWPFHSFWEEVDLSREINTSFTEWHHYHYYGYSVSGSSSQCCIPLKLLCLFSSILVHYKNLSRQSVISGSSSQCCIPLKLLCLFSSILVHYKILSRQSVIKVPNQHRTHTTFSYQKLCSHVQLLPVISLPGISPMQLKFFRWSTNASTLVSISTYTR